MRPSLSPVAEIQDLDGREPFVGLVIDGDARAYPLRMLTCHETVNDVVASVPVAVTFYPLCNTTVVFAGGCWNSACPGSYATRT